MVNGRLLTNLGAFDFDFKTDLDKMIDKDVWFHSTGQYAGKIYEHRIKETGIVELSIHLDGINNSTK